MQLIELSIWGAIQDVAVCNNNFWQFAMFFITSVILNWAFLAILKIRLNIANYLFQMLFGIFQTKSLHLQWICVGDLHEKMLLFIWRWCFFQYFIWNTCTFVEIYTFNNFKYHTIFFKKIVAFTINLLNKISLQVDIPYFLFKIFAHAMNSDK